MSNIFTISNIRSYLGPSFYLDQQAFTFDLCQKNPVPVDRVWPVVTAAIPALDADRVPETFDELFARTVIGLQQLDMDLFATKWTVSKQEDGSRIAVQYIDPKTCERCIRLAQDWISDIVSSRSYPFKARYEEVQKGFHKSGFGGPTIFSIIESGYRNGIPMFYLKSEDVFQWGQGRKQLRGRSTVLHRDSIKDTELTTYKDLAKAFLDDLGFPVPRGRLCYTLDELQKYAEEIGYPVVTKPVAGHKGQGVTTGIMSRGELQEGFEIAKEASENRNDAIIVEKHVTGTDHRLLTISGKFVAALQRIPAHVIGDGTHSIEELIEIENSRPERADTPRSPLGKIKIDDNLVSFIRDKGISLRDVPTKGEEIILRRVANISAGGVSKNVTDVIHPLNIKLAEDVARFLDVHVLGIDLLAEDISKPWTESPCSIIEINAGPGVFMHLVPAVGESINVPERIFKAFFPTGDSARVPTIVFNKLPKKIAQQLCSHCLDHSAVEEAGVAALDGVWFNNQFFSKRPEHISNIRNVMRNPRLDVVMLEYSENEIRDEGLYHWGADVVVLDDPTLIETVLARDLLPGATLIQIDRKGKKLLRTHDGEVTEIALKSKSVDAVLVQELQTLLDGLIDRYCVKAAVKTY